MEEKRMHAAIGVGAGKKKQNPQQAGLGLMGLVKDRPAGPWGDALVNPS
jgi:hypothetical protein